MKISQILVKIDEKQLFVPAFQREYVWKRGDAKNLISSLLNDYPTGTMLTWETSTPPELKGGHVYSSSQGAVKLILDGQQRITTLYMLISGKIPPYYTEKEIINDIRGLYINVLTMELEYYKKTVMENNPAWLDITHIFQGKTNALEVIKELAEAQDISHEEQLKVMANVGSVEKITDREFLEQSIPVRATIREAIDIFYRVNSSGVNLTDAELALAQISGFWPDARDHIKKKMFEMEKHGWVFKLDFFIYCLLGVVHNVGSKMEKLHDESNKEPVRLAWEQLESDTLDYVCNILKSNACIDHTKEINSIYALIPIVVFSFNKGKERMSDIEIKKVIKWFYYSQLRTRYVSQLPQKLDKDIGIVVREESPFDKLLSLIEDEKRLEVRPEEFIGVGIQHPLWGLMTWYLKSKGARCLTTGVGIRKNMGKKYALEWDHIFPFSILKDNGYGWEDRHKYNLAQEITNRAILTQTGNRTKSNKFANDYLRNVREKFPELLKGQVIPENEHLWDLKNYEDFLVERRRMLAEELNIFLDNITETEVLPNLITAQDLIEQGENHGVELKTTLRWDIEKLRVNKELEAVVLKTIAAFSNLEGGVLLIGVMDDGEVEGLEADYNTLRKSDKDGFELHLSELVTQEYGVDFAATGLTIEFPTVDDKEICLVDIRAGVKPLYTMTKDKNGQKSSKFYLRRGNSSKEMDITEISDYIATRFGST